MTFKSKRMKTVNYFFFTLSFMLLMSSNASFARSINVLCEDKQGNVHLVEVQESDDRASDIYSGKTRKVNKAKKKVCKEENREWIPYYHD